MEKEMCFSDYIEVLFDTGDSAIYNPAFSNELGLYLYGDEHIPIREINLINSKLFIHYLNGKIRMLDNQVTSVCIENIRFKRRMKMSIEGTLFKYSINDASLYDLDKTRAFDYEVLNSKTKKRSL